MTEQTNTQEHRQSIARTRMRHNGAGEYVVNVEFRREARSELQNALSILHKDMGDVEASKHGSPTVQYPLSRSISVEQHLQILAQIGLGVAALDAMRPHIERALNPSMRNAPNLGLTQGQA